MSEWIEAAKAEIKAELSLSEYELHHVGEIVAKHAPGWHPKPTGPGAWACLPLTKATFSQTVVLDLNDDDLARGAPFLTRAVYGPIPKETP